jgi:hypothetical protein
MNPDEGNHHMKLTNDSYTILICDKTWTEQYFRDKAGWVKVSARGRRFRATAEQVLNHLLPALAGIKPNLIVKVEHRAPAARKTGERKHLGRTPALPVK